MSTEAIGSQQNSPGFSRREFVNLSGKFILLSWLAACAKAPPNTPSAALDPYSGWSKYIDRQLPKELVTAVGRDIEASDIPGFSEVGSVIILSQTEPSRLREYFPAAETPNPLAVKLHSSFPALGGMGLFLETADEIQRDVRDKSTQNVERRSFLPVQKVTMEIALADDLVYAPTLAKQLILVKEFSHFLYFQQHQSAVVDQVRLSYDVQRGFYSDDFFLYLSSVYKPFNPRFPSLGDLFDNASIDFDGAGYWHVMRAFGYIKQHNLFDPLSLEVFHSMDEAYTKAREVGILLEDNSWREGITPFSPEWTPITREILKDREKYTRSIR